MPKIIENVNFIATKSSNKNICKINIHQIKGMNTITKEINMDPTKKIPIIRSDNFSPDTVFYENVLKVKDPTLTEVKDQVSNNLLVFENINRDFMIGKSFEIVKIPKANEIIVEDQYKYIIDHKQILGDQDHGIILTGTRRIDFNDNDSIVFTAGIYTTTPGTGYLVNKVFRNYKSYSMNYITKDGKEQLITYIEVPLKDLENFKLLCCKLDGILKKVDIDELKEFTTRYLKDCLENREKFEVRHISFKKDERGYTIPPKVESVSVLGASEVINSSRIVKGETATAIAEDFAEEVKALVMEEYNIQIEEIESSFDLSKNDE
jgi:hypothetical protein